MKQSARHLMVLIAVVLSGAAAPAHAQRTLTQDEALRLAFPPPARVDRRTAYLDEAQAQRASRLAGGPALTQRVVTYYVGSDARGPLGVAWFDSHRVRTHGEVLMFVVGPDGTIRRTEVLQFAEPPEYQAPDRWLALFGERALGDDLSLKRGIPNITGATLTAQAVTAAARRVLALHAVIEPFAVRP